MQTVTPIDYSYVKSKFLPRKLDSHKGTYGTLMCLCGSEGMLGAAVMSTKSALKCGVGLVNVCVQKSLYPILAANLLEPVFTVLYDNQTGRFLYSNIFDIMSSCDKASACLIGCGIGCNRDTQLIVNHIIENCLNPMIIDADGINAISKNIDILRTAKAPIVITPHPGEMARLIGRSTEYIQSHREDCARELALKYDITVVLKGSGTVIACNNGNVYINNTGNPGMSKGGSGDVLSGMIASFMAQGFKAEDACVCGVYLHGLAGDRCASNLSQISMSPVDIINYLPRLFLEIEN